jgi:hypothetical protein
VRCRPEFEQVSGPAPLYVDIKIRYSVLPLVILSISLSLVGAKISPLNGHFCYVGARPQGSRHSPVEEGHVTDSPTIDIS